MRDNCPASAKLEHELTTSRSFNPYSGKVGESLYSINMFENLIQPREFGMRQNLSQMDQTQKRLSPLVGIDWFGSKSSAPKEQSTQKTSSEAKEKAKTKKTLSLKEKYKRKILANKRKNQLKKAKEAGPDTTPLSTESKVTLEKPRKDAKEMKRKTKKGPNEDDSDKQEKTTAKKKSTIINPNVVVNNFSFKGDQKAAQENNSFLQNQPDSRNQPPRDSDFSLTNLKENTSRESVDEHKLNIFRVFDHENSSEKTPMLSPKESPNSGKGIDHFLLKDNCLSRQTSRDSFRDFDFKMNSEAHDSDEDSDGGEIGRGFGDTLSDVALKRLAQMSGEFECLQGSNMRGPLDTLKNTFSGQVGMDRTQLATPTMTGEFLTFHSECVHNCRTSARVGRLQCSQNHAQQATLQPFFTLREHRTHFIGARVGPGSHHLRKRKGPTGRPALLGPAATLRFCPAPGPPQVPLHFAPKMSSFACAEPARVSLPGRAVQRCFP